MKGPDGLTILTSELTTVVSPVLSVTLRLRLNAAPDHHSSSGWPPSWSPTGKIYIRSRLDEVFIVHVFSVFWGIQYFSTMYLVISACFRNYVEEALYKTKTSTELHKTYHGVLWAMPAQKADPMGDIVLSTIMGHGWTILWQGQLFLLGRFWDLWISS